MLKQDISDIQCPSLVQTCDFPTFWKVRIDWQTMSGIGCYRLELLHMAKQFFLAHEPQHTLMVDRVATILRFCCDTPVPVIRKFQSYLLNQVNPI